MLGWIAPELVRPSATQVLLFTIRSLEMDSGLRAVEVTLRDDLYYVIEVREGKGYDRNLPGEGVLIYLVDESKKGGYGVVRVADRNSLTKLLDDAPFRVGDMFEDDENSVYVAVVLEEESGFTVAISGSKILSLKDADGDGLFDHVEERLGTDPRKPDSDGDGMTDGEEVNKYKTSPVKRDSDGDGLSDGDEVKKFRTNPLLADTDNDTLPDGDEVNKYHTDPLNADTDRDGSSDYEEVKYGTNPLEPDTDGDGVIDGDETTFGTNPLQWDTDGDLWNDGLDVAPKNPLVPNILLVAVAAVAVLIVAVRRKRSSVRTRYAPRSSEVTSAQMTGAVQTKYCSECGFALSLGANSCSKCGARQSYYGDGGD